MVRSLEARTKCRLWKDGHHFSSVGQASSSVRSTDIFPVKCQGVIYWEAVTNLLQKFLENFVLLVGLLAWLSQS